MARVTPLTKALELFTTVESPAQLQTLLAEETKPAVVLSLSTEEEWKQRQAQEGLLLPLVFLVRGRSDITLLVSHASEVEVPSLSVFKTGEKTVSVTANGTLKERVMALVDQIGWSPDCPNETELPNYLSPIDARDLLMDVVAFTSTQRDNVANAANVSAIIWHAFVNAGRPINWAGFYFLRPLANPKEEDHSRILILGPFMGKPACSRIRLESGVCGAAVLSKSVQRIADVHEFPGHIACDDASASELVVPVLDKQGEVIALIDLDCPEPNGFSAADVRTLVEVARVISEASDWHNVDLPYSQ